MSRDWECHAGMNPLSAGRQRGWRRKLAWILIVPATWAILAVIAPILVVTRLWDEYRRQITMVYRKINNMVAETAGSVWKMSRRTGATMSKAGRDN